MNRIENYPTFIVFLFFIIVTFFLSSLAFIIPKWYAQWPGAQSTFQNIGLWEVCFNGFMHEDIYDRLFSDCFYTEYHHISELRPWIVRSWFQAARVFFAINYLCNMLAVFLGIAMTLGIFSVIKKRFGYIIMVFLVVSWSSCLATLILWGVGTKDLESGDWMPNPDKCTLSWSYGSASLALLGCSICIGVLVHALLQSRGHHSLLWRFASSGSGQQQHQMLPLREPELTLSPGSHKLLGTSIYDPRGTPTDSKMSLNQPPSIMASSHLSQPKSENVQTHSQVGSSMLFSQAGEPRRFQKRPNYHGSESDLRIENPKRPSHHGSGSDIRIEKPTGTSAGNSQLSTGRPGTVAMGASVARPTVVVSATPMRRK